VSTPAEAGRILTGLLAIGAQIGRDVVVELGAFIDRDLKSLPQGLDVPLPSLIDGLDCFAVERTLLNRAPQLVGEDALRGDDQPAKARDSLCRWNPSA
jgi:hypothetical protein